jgi:hypothetical protein
MARMSSTQARSAASTPLLAMLPDPGHRVGAATPAEVDDVDPATVILTCANCGAAMDERRCKLICRCGYFLSCSDYY